LLGAVEPLGVVVLLGVVVVLPGWQGFALAMVPEVPLGVEVDEPVDPVVELLVPLFEVEEVEGVLLAVVEVPALPLLEGVHGATVVEVPVWFCVVPCVPPVTDPALPATPGVP
jgi:hypothetical protein